MIVALLMRYSFGNLENYRKPKILQYLKLTTQHNFIELLTPYVLKIVIFSNFFVYPPNQLQNYATNQSMLKHRLKHKCLIIKTFVMY